VGRVAGSWLCEEGRGPRRVQSGTSRLTETGAQQLGLLGPHRANDLAQRDLQHLVIEEDQRIEGLVLRGRRHMAIQREMTDELADLSRSRGFGPLPGCESVGAFMISPPWRNGKVES